MSEQKKMINFTVACVNEFAQKHNLSTKEAFQYLFQFKGIEFIKENYEVEHLLSLDAVVEDLFILCKRNGDAMKLYHGSNTQIQNINLSMCRPYKDFGTGFYLTDIKEQAERMLCVIGIINTILSSDRWLMTIWHCCSDSMKMN